MELQFQRIFDALQNPRLQKADVRLWISHHPPTETTGIWAAIRLTLCKGSIDLQRSTSDQSIIYYVYISKHKYGLTPGAWTISASTVGTPTCSNYIGNEKTTFIYANCDTGQTHHWGITTAEISVLDAFAYPETTQKIDFKAAIPALLPRKFCLAQTYLPVRHPWCQSPTTNRSAPAPAWDYLDAFEPSIASATTATKCDRENAHFFKRTP